MQVLRLISNDYFRVEHPKLTFEANLYDHFLVIPSPIIPIENVIYFLEYFVFLFFFIVHIPICFDFVG